MLKYTRNTNNSGVGFYKQINNEQHCTKTTKMLGHTKLPSKSYQKY